MIRIVTVLVLSFCFTSVFAQKIKVKVKNDILIVNDVKTAKIEGERNKELLGLVKDFTISNMDGKELFTAVYSDLFPETPGDNSSYHFEFNFLELDQKAYFKISKLGVAKSLGNLIGKGQLIKDGKVDAKALKALIAKKGKTPPIVVTYEMADRPRNFPVELREKGSLEQASTVFCTYRDLGTIRGMDVYEFYAPDGTLALTVSFADGNNAQLFIVKTLRDGKENKVSLPTKEKVKFVAAIDRNYLALKRIAKWIVDKNYL